jgi:hypothetical protein
VLLVNPLVEEHKKHLQWLGWEGAAAEEEADPALAELQQKISKQNIEFVSKF